MTTVKGLKQKWKFNEARFLLKKKDAMCKRVNIVCCEDWIVVKTVRYVIAVLWPGNKNDKMIFDDLCGTTICTVYLG